MYRTEVGVPSGQVET